MEKRNKEFAESNKGKDKIRGRPIKLNKAKLKLRPNKDYAEILFLGDIHYGHPQSKIERAEAMIEYATEKGIYIFCMGDMLECGLSGSIGDSVYKQELNPQEQMERIIEVLRPASERGLVIGYLMGNHEQRITNSTGIDISKVICSQLSIPYLGYAGWSVLSINGTRYSIYASHGSGGSRFKHTKLKKVIDMCAWISSDIIAMGHVHSIASEVVIKQSYNRTNNKIEEVKQYVCLTGSYISWNDTYAEAKGFPPTKLGSPKAKLFKGKKGVHFSF